MWTVECYWKGSEPTVHIGEPDNKSSPFLYQRSYQTTVRYHPKFVVICCKHVGTRHLPEKKQRAQHHTSIYNVTVPLGTNNQQQ